MKKRILFAVLLLTAEIAFADAILGLSGINPGAQVGREGISVAAVPVIPGANLLNEDSTPLLNEDGSNLTNE